MKSRHLLQILSLIALLALTLIPVHAASLAPPTITPEVGKTYFTRSTFFHEKNVHQATNFSRGETWPINTEVRLKDMTESKHGKLVLERVDNGQTVTVQNVPKHTSISIQELASRMLAGKKTPIEKLAKDIQESVKAGELRLGMNKEVALMTRGYPPTVLTPSVDNDTWVYQENRFAKRTIVFKKGVIAEGRELR